MDRNRNFNVTNLQVARLLKRGINTGVAAAYPGKRAAVFEELRRRLFGIAYRMIGTTADAEDIVQEAYLRWHQADTGEIRSAEAWLVSVVTRLSIDKLRKASVEREKYIGPCETRWFFRCHKLALVSSLLLEAPISVATRTQPRRMIC